ncbi:hypothetical protein BGX31_001542, partial [Mortierella sp. GBA43]
MASFKDFIARFKSALKLNKATETVTVPDTIETIAGSYGTVDRNNIVALSDKMYTIL